MFTCQRARQVWSAMDMTTAIDNVLPIDRSGSVVLEEILRHQNPTIPSLGKIGFKEAIAVGAWYIWWQRREAVKGEQIKSPANSAFAIMALTANYQGASSGAEPQEITWSKPLPHTYKLNIDAAYFPNGSGAAGAVLRNNKGEALAGGCWPLSNLLDAGTAEAMALLKGL